MIPVDKVREIIKKHEILEKELSSGTIEKKQFDFSINAVQELFDLEEGPRVPYPLPEGDEQVPIVEPTRWPSNHKAPKNTLKGRCTQNGATWLGMQR